MNTQVIKQTSTEARVCVPNHWSDKDATQYVNQSAKIDGGWTMRKQANTEANDPSNRVCCATHVNNAHVAFDSTKSLEAIAAMNKVEVDKVELIESGD